MEKEMLKIFGEDIVTLKSIESNKNYQERLKEAYDHVKSLGINSLEEFVSSEDVRVGAFTYHEITIFDRIRDDEYRNLLTNTVIHLNSRELVINDPNYGDKAASWGTLGKTPYRKQYIREGYITHGLTDEERKTYL